MGNDMKSLSHTKWNCKYHIVFAPKYRRKVFFGEKKVEIGKILRKLCEWKDIHSTELTQLMLSELIEKIEVFHAEKVDGVTVQRLNIHYHCVGEIEIPEAREIPAITTSIHTRQGVDVVYYPKTKSA